MTRAPLADSLRRIVPLAWPVFVGQIAVLAFATVDTVLAGRYASLDLAALAIGGAVYATAVSRPKAVMLLQLGALVCKLPLSVLLVFGAGDPASRWHLPALGATGCGAATAIVMWLQCAAAWQLLRRDPFYARFFARIPASHGLDARDARHVPHARPAREVDHALVPASFSVHSSARSPARPSARSPAAAALAGGWSRPDRASLAGLLRLGIPMGLSIGIEVAGFTFMAIFVARLGATPVAGHQIAVNLVSMMFMMPFAIANAASTLVAQRIGAADPADAGRIAWHGVELGVTAAALLGGTVYLLRGRLVGLYSSDLQVLAAALPLLAWVGVFHIADAAQTVAAFILRAYGIATAPLVIYAVAIWGIGIGGGYLLAFGVLPGTPESLQGASGFWSAATVGLAVAALGMTAFLRWTLARQQRTSETPQPA